MWISNVFAHEMEEQISVVPQPSLDQVIRINSFNFTYLAIGFILILVVLSILFKDKAGWFKLSLFIAMTLIILTNTIYLTGSTIYLNQVSVTGGPVHYHADFGIYSCGQEVNIKDPEGFSNKTGTEVIHEHNDKRMHIEGVLLELHDSSISHFFEELGGKMAEDSLTIPTNEGERTLKSGDQCPGGKIAHLQVFVYQTKNGVVNQKKLTDPANYIISPEGNVPPGDCIIIELDSVIKNKTDKICLSYKVAKETGKIHGN